MRSGLLFMLKRKITQLALAATSTQATGTAHGSEAYAGRHSRHKQEVHRHTLAVSFYYKNDRYDRTTHLHGRAQGKHDDEERALLPIGKRLRRLGRLGCRRRPFRLLLLSLPPRPVSLDLRLRQRVPLSDRYRFFLRRAAVDGQPATVSVTAAVDFVAPARALAMGARQQREVQGLPPLQRVEVRRQGLTPAACASSSFSCG